MFLSLVTHPAGRGKADPVTFREHMAVADAADHPLGGRIGRRRQCEHPGRGNAAFGTAFVLPGVPCRPFGFGGHPGLVSRRETVGKGKVCHGEVLSPFPALSARSRSRGG